ncbi:MAG: hypothetical protein HONBIEJF_01617 [Fimbriimonadaceae bacterium]|nr:hypothetical protein [Fimbriimonadaceae bacterium]
MTLQVPFRNFISAVSRHLERPLVYLHRDGATTTVSAADPGRGVVVTSTTDESLSKIKERLDHEGFSVSDGQWTEGHALQSEEERQETYIGAVAYRTRDESPGLWLDAFPSEPTPAIVLQAIYSEFETHGEMGEVSFEEFLRLAKPTVVIVSPEQVAAFLRQRAGC